jgi:iron complex outermembrane receptor protein/outer membrane receptor for ferrienterochelin and colicins
MKLGLALLLCLLLGKSAAAQNAVRFIVKDSASGEPLAGVVAAPESNPAAGTISGAGGAGVIQGLKDGTDTIYFSYLDYRTASLAVYLPDTTLHYIALAADQTQLGEVVIVASTRTNDRIENAATRVEVLGLEELNEESTLKPGNVASILGDVSGVQIQQSSAVSGNSNVRIQGLDGRYTQMLRDGMPLFEGFSGGFGVLSIPPLDLKQLELIKGSASTLYGGGAIAGLVNFISKRPGNEPDASFVLNGTTLKEGNFNAYWGQRWKRFGFTFFGGETVQREGDVDGDGLSDVPRLSSTLIHPTLFFYPTGKSSISLGWSGSFEKRTGGDMLAIDGGGDFHHPYFETNRLQRNTFTLIADTKLTTNLSGTVKGTYSLFNRDITTNTYTFRGAQQNYYAEASLSARLKRHNLVGGINVTGDDFRPSEATPAIVGAIANNVVGIFTQDTWLLPEGTKLEGGLRLDYHKQYGAFVLPRIAVFHRFDRHWGARGGFGLGYKTPNPLTPQIRDYGIYDIRPIAAGADAERSFGANLEGNYRYQMDEEHTFFLNHAFFLTQLTHPYVGTELADGTLAFYSASQPVITKGFDTYIQIRLAAWEAYLGYTYTDARRNYLPQDNFVPLTPRNRAAGTLVYDMEGKWRFGIEASYNGSQYRDGDTKTPAYVFVAALVERRFGPGFSLVLNGENLLDERQSRYEPIYTGAISSPDYKPLWAPIDGRVLNLALRFQPFAR